MLVPVALSKIHTTDGNIVVISCQVLMSDGKLSVGLVCVLAPGGKIPGLKAHWNTRCVLRWTEACLRQAGPAPPAEAGGSHRNANVG
jgi:hypothetical protein